MIRPRDFDLSDLLPVGAMQAPAMAGTPTAHGDPRDAARVAAARTRAIVGARGFVTVATRPRFFGRDRSACNSDRLRCAPGRVGQ